MPSYSRRDRSGSAVAKAVVKSSGPPAVADNSLLVDAAKQVAVQEEESPVLMAAEEAVYNTADVAEHAVYNTADVAEHAVYNTADAKAAKEAVYNTADVAEHAVYNNADVAEQAVEQNAEVDTDTYVLQDADEHAVYNTADANLAEETVEQNAEVDTDTYIVQDAIELDSEVYVVADAPKKETDAEALAARNTKSREAWHKEMAANKKYTSTPLRADYVGEETNAQKGLLPNAIAKRGAANPMPYTMTGTHYASSRDEYGASIVDGKLSRGGKAIDTGASERQWMKDKDGRFNFAMDAGGGLYAADPRAAIEASMDDTSRTGKRSNHSSLVGGAAVSAAGTLKVSDGKVEEIGDGSGHYRPGIAQTHQAASRLIEGGAMDELRSGVSLSPKTAGQKELSVSSVELMAYGPEMAAARQNYAATGDTAALSAPEAEIRRRHAVKSAALDEIGSNPQARLRSVPSAERRIASDPVLTAEGEVGHALSSSPKQAAAAAPLLAPAPEAALSSSPKQAAAGAPLLAPAPSAGLSLSPKQAAAGAPLLAPAVAGATKVVPDLPQVGNERRSVRDLKKLWGG
jgi:hypothetical protein